MNTSAKRRFVSFSVRHAKCQDCLRIAREESMRAAKGHLDVVAGQFSPSSILEPKVGPVFRFAIEVRLPIQWINANSRCAI